MRRDRYTLLLAVFAAAFLFFAGSAAAQLAGSDVGPGDSCAGYPAGASTMTADADLNEKDVILICDGSIWVAAGGGTAAGGDREIQLNSGGSFATDTNFVFTSTGRLGIGRTDPQNNLHIETDGDHAGISIIATNGNWDPHIVFGNGFVDTEDDWSIGMDDSNSDAFTISNDMSLGADTKLVILPNGEVGIGNGSPAGLLEVGSGILFVSGSSGFVGIGDTTPNVALDVAGDIEYTGVLTAVSDIRLKHDIRPVENPLKKLTSLHGLSYEKKTPKGADSTHDVREYGFAAQEVQEIFPELVREGNDEMGTLSVNYIGLIAPMVEAMKQQQAEIERQRARLTAQTEHIHKTEDRLRTLEAQNAMLLDRLEALEAGSMQ